MSTTLYLIKIVDIKFNYNVGHKHHKNVLENNVSITYKENKSRKERDLQVKYGSKLKNYRKRVFTRHTIIDLAKNNFKQIISIVVV